MFLKDFLLNLLRTNREDIVAIEEKEVTSKLGLTSIVDVKEREEVKVGGVLEAITYHPSSSSSALGVGATLYDGTSSIDIMWLGRKKIPGIVVGVHIIVEGRVVKQNGRLAIMNPIYEIVSDTIL